MKKSIIIILSIITIALLLVVGAVIYVYSQSGNARIQSFVEEKIQEQTGLPITFSAFRLTKGHLYFIAVLGKEASLGFDGKFNILGRNLNGRYLLKATNAKYQKYTLRQANISGAVRGTVDNLYIDGKGTLLDNPAVYKLNIKNKVPQDILVQLRKIPLDELLAIAGQPKIVHGQLNADVILPSIGKNGSKGQAIVQLANARFDPVLIRKLYHYTLPTDKTSLKGQLRANLVDTKVTFEGKVLSDMISIQLKNGQADIEEKNAACDVSLNTPELAPLTQNKLHGPMKLSGALQYDTLGVHVRAKTGSLGGDITLDYTKSVLAILKNVSLGAILKMVGQPKYADGKINGKLSLESTKVQDGHYDLKLSSGKLYTKLLNKEMGTSLPPKVNIDLDSSGAFVRGVLSAKTKLSSNLLSATLTKTRFEIKSGKLDTDYRLHIPNPLLLAGKSGKGVPVTLAGKVAKNKILRVQGAAKGLGKKLVFDYAGESLKVDGKGVNVGRLLASAGQPVALSGLMDAQIDLKTIKPPSGVFSITSPKLKTNPKVMQKLMDKPLDTYFSISLKGRAKKGVMYAKGDIKSPLMILSMPKIVFDAETGGVSSPFHAEVPKLESLQSLTGTKLVGKFVTNGYMKTGKQINLSGTTTSIGGKITYSYLGTKLKARMISVPLPKLLHLVDQPEQLLGTANASMSYNTKNKKGKAHITVNKFQFKPGKLTSAVKLVLQKDLAQIIYDRTVADATFNGDNISYKATAKGARSDFAINDGKLNTKTKTNQAHFSLRVDQIDVQGEIKGTTKDPKITVLPGKMMQEKIKKKALGKAKEVIKKNAGGTVKKLIKKLPFL